MVGVEQMVGLFAQGRLQICPVQGLHIRVLVGEADGSLGVQLPQLAASGGCHFHALVDGLSTAAGAAPGAGHDFHEVVVHLAAVHGLHQLPGVGQAADHGVLTSADCSLRVLDVKKTPKGYYVHTCVLESGIVKVGDHLTAKVDKEYRMAIARNHTATHLLQAALREVLGDHVHQAGSYQDASITHFDFTHFSAVTPEELARVQKIVNDKIFDSMNVTVQEMPVEEAKKLGAMMLFGEKYGNIVRVVKAGDFSTEFCGGTHVSNTSAVQAFKIISEAGIQAGVRRIEALTSKGVFEYYDQLEETLKEAAKLLKATPANLVERVNHVLGEVKALQSENESLKSKAAKDALGDVMNQVEEVAGVKLLATSVSGVDMNGLRDLGDQLKEKLGEGVIVLASDCDGKVNLVAMATEEAMGKGAHAGNLIKGIAAKVGGGGGGRPNMAQAGGKNPAGIKDALTEAKTVLAQQLA